MILQLEDISKGFGAHQVLNPLTAKIEDQDRIGLIGVNGAGKSTLLNIIYGELEPDTGILSRSASHFGFLRQNSGLNSQNTIAQEMHMALATLVKMQKELAALQQEMAALPPQSPAYEPLAGRYASLLTQFEQQDGYTMEVRIDTVLNGMGFGQTDRQTPVAVLSGGEKTRLALCKLLLEQPELLILDEPTNHLDFKTLLWLEDYLSGWKKALLVVSHDRYFLDRLCGSVWELDQGTLYTYKGNYSRYVEQRAQRLELQEKQYWQQQQDIQKLEDFVARNLARASTTGRAQSRQKILDKMERIERPHAPSKPARLEFGYDKDPVKDVLHVKDLSLAVDTTEGKQVLCSHIDLDILRGEKVALIGANGIGKTTLLRALQKLHIPESGQIFWGQNTVISYFEQGELDLEPSKPVLNALWDVFPREYEHTIRTILGHVQLTGENVFKKVGDLSGGEKARLKFAIMLMKKGNVLLLDEPTNHLDLNVKESLDKALQQFEGTVLAVSHDRYLLNKFPTKIVEMHRDHIRVYKGNYDAYLRQKEAATPMPVAPEMPAASAPEATPQYRSKKQRSIEVARKKELRDLEDTIELLESEISELEELIASPRISGDYLLLQQHCDSLEAKRLELGECMNRWTILCDQIS
ncbi:ABC-F family ATP-binding cassette domain-containing protein [Oscillospiraceae bacterium MB08-C2-2]|nr:ABC-F family ATP-binding cassette domain-containing protein [Oscillospiraceae bacterium MB08-C2-2]